MSTKSNKSWKDHLLSSGVPLEYSVRRIFEELGIHNPSEYRYVRKTARRVSRRYFLWTSIRRKLMFTAICGSNIVECKYRHDGTNWVFVPQEYGEFFGPGLADLFVTLDQCCLDRELDRSVLEKFRSKYPLCAKGIELLPEDTNPKTIEQAVQQLRYAVVALAMDTQLTINCFTRLI